MQNGAPLLVQRFDADGRTKISNIAWVYKNVGRTMEVVAVNVVATNSRPKMRQVAQLHSSSELFSGDLATPQAELTGRLCQTFSNYGVQLDSVLLSKPKFNDEFEKVIEQKQITAEQQKVKEQETNVAQQEALRKVAEAEGNKNAAVKQAEAQGHWNITTVLGGSGSGVIPIFDVGGNAPAASPTDTQADPKSSTGG